MKKIQQLLIPRIHLLDIQNLLYFCIYRRAQVKPKVSQMETKMLKKENRNDIIVFLFNFLNF